MIRNIFAEMYNLMTVDNSHEEDNDPFEYAAEPVVDIHLGWIASAVMALLLSVLLIA